MVSSVKKIYKIEITFIRQSYSRVDVAGGGGFFFNQMGCSLVKYCLVFPNINFQTTFSGFNSP